MRPALENARMRPVQSLLLSLCLASPAFAQADEILLIERAADRAGRDHAAAYFEKQRATLRGEDLSPTRLAALLATATGDQVNFAVVTKGDRDAMDTVSVDVENVSLLSALNVVRRTSDLRFVYRAGMVTIKPADEVVELTVLRLYDVGAATAPVRNKPGPKLKLRAPGEEVEEDADDDDGDKTLSGFTVDRIQELIASNVDPDSWDRAGVSQNALHGVLMIRQTERNHAKIERLLATLGVIKVSKPRVVKRKASKKRAKGAAQKKSPSKPKTRLLPPKKPTRK